MEELNKGGRPTVNEVEEKKRKLLEIVEKLSNPIEVKVLAEKMEMTEMALSRYLLSISDKYFVMDLGRFVFFRKHDTNILKGKWFHTFKDGKIHNQGQILDISKDEKSATIQLYSFFDREPTIIKVVDFEELKTYTLYDTVEIMRQKYEESKEMKI